MLDRSRSSVDPLSDMLSFLKPRSVGCGVVNAGDISIAFPAQHGVKCHAIVVGEAWIATDDAKTFHLKAGDVCILVHRNAYRFATDLTLPSTGYHEVLADLAPGHVTTLNGGDRATIISASFSVDERHAAMLLDVLPPVAHLPDDAERAVLPELLRRIQYELHNAQPGNRLVVEQLTMMMLVHVLRSYGAAVGESRAGWLFALADTQIGAAIEAMHDAPAHRWTVDTLAKHAGMSRTSFAVRFKACVNSAPMTYLARLRMLKASEMLSVRGNTLDGIAVTFGYASESAFSHAFKRHFGCSPRRYRTTTK